LTSEPRQEFAPRFPRKLERKTDERSQYTHPDWLRDDCHVGKFSVWVCRKPGPDYHETGEADASGLGPGPDMGPDRPVKLLSKVLEKIAVK